MKRFNKYFFVAFIICSFFLGNCFVQSANLSLQQILENYKKYEGKTLTISGAISSVSYENGGVFKVTPEGQITMYSQVYIYLLKSEGGQIYITTFKELKVGDQVDFKVKILITSDEKISTNSQSAFFKYIVKKYDGSKIDDSNALLQKFISQLPSSYSSWVLSIDVESQPTILDSN